MNYEELSFKNNEFHLVRSYLFIYLLILLCKRKKQKWKRIIEMLHSKRCLINKDINYYKFFIFIFKN